MVLGACLRAVFVLAILVAPSVLSAIVAQPAHAVSAAYDEGYGINDFQRSAGKSRVGAYENPTAKDAEWWGVQVPKGSNFAVFVKDNVAVVFNHSDLKAKLSVRAYIEEKDDKEGTSGLYLSKDVDTWYYPDGNSYTVTTDSGKKYTFVYDQTVNDTAYALGSSRESFDYIDFGTFVLASQVVSTDVPFLQYWGQFFSNIDYTPLWISLKTAFVAMIFVFVLGLLAAWKTAHASARVKSICDSLFTLPMVMPPTVVGFFLLVCLGNSTPLGQWFIAHGLRIVFTWPACVIAAAVVSFPLLYRTARGAFESLDENMLDAARTLGFSEWKTFLRLMIPLSWPTIASGTVLAFARAMGEFGATLFVAGNMPGITQTIPIAIYYAWMGGDLRVAGFWVVIVIILSFIIILGINKYADHAMDYRKLISAEQEERAS